MRNGWNNNFNAHRHLDLNNNGRIDSWEERAAQNNWNSWSNNSNDRNSWRRYDTNRNGRLDRREREQMRRDNRW